MISENITATSYLCKYSVLDSLLGNIVTPGQIVNLYFDTKNILSALHIIKEQERLLFESNSETDRWVITRTIILLMNHWMRYFKKRNITCNIFFFDERGDSTFHYNHSKKYKQDRKITRYKKLYDDGLDETFIKNFHVLYDNNMRIVSKICNIVNNIFYIGLQHLESDFVPKYLMNELFTNEDGSLDKNYLNVIVGNDKDFGQLLTDNNIFQLVKTSEKIYEIRNKDNALEKFVKMPFTENEKLRNAAFIPLMLAISGDDADSIYGISGIGYKTCYKFLNKLYSNKIITDDDYDVNDFYVKIKEYKKINPNFFNDKTAHAIISNEDKVITNFNLASFDRIIDWLTPERKKTLSVLLEKIPSNKIQREKVLSTICMTKNSFDYLI